VPWLFRQTMKVSRTAVLTMGLPVGGYGVRLKADDTIFGQSKNLLAILKVLEKMKKTFAEALFKLWRTCFVPD